MESVFLDDEELYDAGIDFRRYYKALIRRWWLVLIVTLIVTVPWTLYIFTLPHQYEARAVIRFISFDGNDPALTESRPTVLTSRSFAERVVAQMGLSLSIDTEDQEQISRRQVFSHVSTTQNPIPGDYFLTFVGSDSYALRMILEDERETVISEGMISNIVEKPLNVNGFTIQLAQNFRKDSPEVAFKIETFRNVVRNFRGKTETNWNRSGNLMTITLTDTDPNLAAEMTNRLAEIFVRESASLKTRDVEKKSQLLEEQLLIARAELAEADKALKEFQENNALDLNAEQDIQVKQLVNDEAERKALVSYKNTLEVLLQKSDDELNSVNANGTAAENRRYIFSQLAAHRYFDNHPTMLFLREKLKDQIENWRMIVAGSSEQNPRALHC